MNPKAAPAQGFLTDVAGLKVGHHTDTRRPTGCTVVLCEDGATCGVDVRGGAPGTRETDLLRPQNTVDQVHAVLLSGGSAFGLDAASGVMRWLDERGLGLAVGSVRVPIVPAAVLFDLNLGDAGVRPGPEQGYAACEAARAAPEAQGSVGAGAGASVGKLFGMARAMKGGIGSACLRLQDCSVAALVAVNAVGDVLDEQGRVIAGARTEDGRCLLGTTAALEGGACPARMLSGTATTLAVVATDARLGKAQATQLAALAHHGLSRAIDPLTPLDGDTVFALATGRSTAPVDLLRLGAMAAEVTARAIRQAVRCATGQAALGLPALRDLR